MRLSAPGRGALRQAPCRARRCSSRQPEGRANNQLSEPVTRHPEVCQDQGQPAPLPHPLEKSSLQSCTVNSTLPTGMNFGVSFLYTRLLPDSHPTSQALLPRGQGQSTEQAQNRPNSPQGEEMLGTQSSTQPGSARTPCLQGQEHTGTLAPEQSRPVLPGGAREDGT